MSATTVAIPNRDVAITLFGSVPATRDGVTARERVKAPHLGPTSITALAGLALVAITVAGIGVSGRGLLLGGTIVAAGAGRGQARHSRGSS